MMAALAASSVVGCSDGGTGEARPLLLLLLAATTDRCEPPPPPPPPPPEASSGGLVSAAAGDGLVSVVAGDGLAVEKAEGMTETGARITFLNVDRKSRLSASRLMLAMKKDSVAAA